MADTQDAVPPASPLTFSEALNHYFEISNELYERKLNGNDSKMTAETQVLVEILRDELTKVADGQGVGNEFRMAVRDELKIEKQTLWLKRTANKMKQAKPSLLSLELLGSAGVVVLISYCVVRLDALLALLLGLLVIGIRLTLPRLLDKVATRYETSLRSLRRITK